MTTPQNAGDSGEKGPGDIAVDAATLDLVTHGAALWLVDDGGELSDAIHGAVVRCSILLAAHTVPSGKGAE